MKKVLVKRSPHHGYGVFAAKDIRKGEVVCRNRFLKIKERDTANNVLGRYVYHFSRDTVALVLGEGSLFNHSPHSNTDHELRGDFFEYRANVKIKKGQELFICYGKNIVYEKSISNPPR